MKRIVCFLATIIMCLSLCACGGNGGASGGNGKFQVGFGKVDVTPEKPVHLASYGDDDTRIMADVMHPIYSHTVAMRDAAGKTLVIITTDLSWGNEKMLEDIRPMVMERFELPSDCVLLGGIHNHNAPHYGYSDTNDMEWKDYFVEGILTSVQIALDDLAPATVEVGRTETENLTFVRRYLLANGDWSGDNFNYNHNSTIVAHESEADEEVQIVRFVRDEQHKDIIMVNWQAHAAKHGHTNNLSADYVGPLRDKVEKEMDAYCIFYQGACGNLNAVSRIAGECPTGMMSYENAVKHGEMVADVVIKALHTEGLMKEIEAGNIQTDQSKFITDSSWDETNTISCGDLSFVTLPAEFFDVLGKTIKDDTPFEMTVLLGFHCGRIRYLPSYEGFLHGGYEPTNTRYRAGDGEKFVEFYLDSLNTLYSTK